MMTPLVEMEKKNMSSLGDDHRIKPLIRPVLGVRDKAEFLNAFRVKSKATS